MYTRENPYSHELMPYALSNYIFVKRCCHKWNKLMSFSSWCLKQNFRGINWGSVWPLIVMNWINMLFQTTFLSRMVITKYTLERILNHYSHELIPHALSNFIFVKKCCHKWSKLMSFSSWCPKQNFKGINWGSVWPFIVMNRINMLFQTTFLSRIVITKGALERILILMNWCHMVFQITFLLNSAVTNGAN